MTYATDSGAATRLASYFAEIGEVLRDKRKRASFATYAMGILGEGERKSVEPIAARACGDPALARAYHERLLHFLGDAKWDDRKVRRMAAHYGLKAMEAQGETANVWIIDDTGLLKQGHHSVGVQRQYTGSAGKIANCQLAVTLSAATSTECIPIDVALYLPESWTSDPARRKKARIPDQQQCIGKIDLAIEMVRQARRDGLQGDIMLADSFYGESADFRRSMRALGFDYAVAIRCNHTKVFPIDRRGRMQPGLEVRELRDRLRPKDFRRYAWRDGSKGSLSGRFCFRRVKTYDGDTPLDERDGEWLIIEWNQQDEMRFYLTTLPQRMSKRWILRILKERWKTERVYEELKGELGFDHFEGRTWPGWHHHMSVVLCCYAFVIAERAQRSPPSFATNASDTHPCAA